MSKLHVIKVWLLLVPFAIQADSNSKLRSYAATGKSFFSVPAQYTTASPEHISLYRADRMIARKDSCEASFQAVGFAGMSTNSDGLARYFFPWQKTCLVVAESPNITPDPSSVPPNAYVGGSAAFQSDSYDLLARNFNIQTAENNFQSRISISPEQTFLGIAFNYRQNLSSTLAQGFWFDITMPVIHVKNEVRLEEKIITPGTPLPGTAANMREAFMNPKWKYGKIAPYGLKKTGVAEIEMRLGYDLLREVFCRFGGFVGLVIPACDRPNGEFLFEPIVGNNHHWGISWGTSSSFRIWQSKKGTSRIRCNIDMNNRYLFQGTERRSLDLYDKSWSRYINLFPNATATNTIPGINVLTQNLKVRPHATYQVNSAITFDWCTNYQFEVGSHLYARQAEEARLSCPWYEGPAIAGAQGAVPAISKFNADSMSYANMHMWNYGLINPDADLSKLYATVVDDTLVYKPIKITDLDVQSALHPDCVGHTIYGTFGYKDTRAELPWVAAVGSSYQFSFDNTIMHRWSVWGKFELSI